MSNRWFFLLFFPLFSIVNGIESPRPDRVYVDHREPKGVGFDQGYSSLGVFYKIPLNFAPFFDLRGHVFNNGRYAINTGVAFRWCTSSFIFGTNLFYDYRKTHFKPYSQLGAGFEALGKTWDFRANGYLPIGCKRTPPYDFFFDLFPDNSFTLTAKREISMSGVDAEVEYHIPPIKWAEIYSAGSIYYYYRGGDFGQSTLGGKLRLLIDLSSYCTLEGSVSYDHLFKWIGQSMARINIPFGPRKKENNLVLQKRFYQPIERAEIIVLNHPRKEL